MCLAFWGGCPPSSKPSKILIGILRVSSGLEGCDWMVNRHTLYSCHCPVVISAAAQLRLTQHWHTAKTAISLTEPIDQLSRGSSRGSRGSRMRGIRGSWLVGQAREEGDEEELLGCTAEQFPCWQLGMVPLKCCRASLCTAEKASSKRPARTYCMPSTSLQAVHVTLCQLKI